MNVTKGDDYGKLLSPGDGITYSNGLIAVPKDVANKHASKNFSALTTGDTYRAMISFVDQDTGGLYTYFVDFIMKKSVPSTGTATYSGISSDWLERARTENLAKNANDLGEDYVRTRREGIYGVRGDVWTGLPVCATSTIP